MRHYEFLGHGDLLSGWRIRRGLEELVDYPEKTATGFWQGLPAQAVIHITINLRTMVGKSIRRCYYSLLVIGDYLPAEAEGRWMARLSKPGKIASGIGIS
jgi:hypothetical protein